VLEPMSRNPALVLIYGMFLFVAGLAIVRFHNRWAADWSVLVTIVSYAGIWVTTFD
jgi:vacuolar-type H+-ATPase subunit I/STV1